MSLPISTQRKTPSPVHVQTVSVTITPSELLSWYVSLHLPPSLCWPLSTCDCDVIIVEQLPCFPCPPLFVILCFWKFKEKKKDSFTYKNKPCKNVQDSYFIYLFLFLFLFVNKMVGISLSLVVIPLLSVYWPIKTCFRLYTALSLVLWLLKKLI